VVYAQAESVDDYPDQQADSESDKYDDSSTEEVEISEADDESEDEAEEEELENLLEEISSKLGPTDQRNSESKAGAQSELEQDEDGTDDDNDNGHYLKYQVPDDDLPVFETLYLPIVHEKNKTGFEESKDFPIMIDSIIAGRYQVQEYLGSAAFSRAVQCIDLTNNQLVCIKIIKNNKDFFDQSLDEIKLLRYINSNGDPDRYNVVQLYGMLLHFTIYLILTPKQISSISRNIYS
jgi:hypothetical protein